MIILSLSGITAFPLPQELALLTQWMGIPKGASPDAYTGLTHWILQVNEGIVATDARFPFMFYGTDWLAFAHVIIAALFIGPFKDPVRNIWIIQWGMIACVGTWPIALICGPLRGIPFAWQMIDCSFGLIALPPLYACYRAIRELERG